jgi:outer membrane biosynthesis protein TonB
MLLEEYEMRAWIGLGKIPNPATNQTERNLPLARISIDILEMLEEKTKNNLDEDEKQLLKNKLVNLRLNYAEEYEKEKKEEASKKEEAKKENTETKKESETPEEKEANSSEEKNTGKK